MNDNVILPTLIVVIFVAFLISDLMRRDLKRKTKKLENKLAAHQAAEELRRGIMAGLAAQAGADLVEPIRVEDIKYGDKVCWRQTDGSNHQHYVAGYDGDPGPSTDGIHARKIAPKGL